jgi:hypothetical protein
MLSLAWRNFFRERALVIRRRTTLFHQRLVMGRLLGR